MDKILQISLLYDFYGEMLTDKQKQVIELYYNDDLSLSEISQEINISRQGVFDLLKRSEKLLDYYEDKLKLVNKFIYQNQKLKEVYDIIKKIDKKDEINKAIIILEEILNL